MAACKVSLTEAAGDHTIPPSCSGGLRPELREFLERCVVPALVEKFLAEQKERDQ